MKTVKVTWHCDHLCQCKHFGFFTKSPCHPWNLCCAMCIFNVTGHCHPAAAVSLLWTVPPLFGEMLEPDLSSLEPLEPGENSFEPSSLEPRAQARSTPNRWSRTSIRSAESQGTILTAIVKFVDWQAPQWRAKENKAWGSNKAHEWVQRNGIAQAKCTEDA